MLRSVAVGNTVDKETFRTTVPQLRQDLIQAQYDLRECDFPMVIIIAGDDRAGVGDLVNRINEWMDSRFIATHVMGDQWEEERMRPAFWRLWRSLPPKGQSALWVGGLFRTVRAHAKGEISDDAMARWTRHLRRMQDELLADGALILKFFVHTPANVQKRKMRQAKKKSQDYWRYDKRDFSVLEELDNGIPAMEAALRDTSVPGAPWTLVEGSDERYRDLTVARTILDALTNRINAGGGRAVPRATTQYGSQRKSTVLDAVDLSRELGKKHYREDLEQQQARLHRLADEARRAGVATVLAFEGWDAGGKGGAIRRVTGALDAADYRVIPVAAPTVEERRYHYLWRFWQYVPRAGRFAIFDRTWYGRVLVERIEGFASEDEWQRAYGEIVDFEEQLTERGFNVQKFWLHISPEEQLARFEAREQTGYKRHKITEEDYRNRDKWDEYVVAVDDMVVRTSTEFAPWHIIAANDKKAARIQVLEAVNAGLQRALDQA